MKILVVDDDRLVLMTLAAMLGRDRHQVTTVNTGAEALATITEFLAVGGAPDAVITDWLMPDIDGLDLAQAIKRHAPAIRVIMCTGFGVVVPADAPIDYLLAKPVRADELRRALGPVS